MAPGQISQTTRSPITGSICTLVEEIPADELIAIYKTRYGCDISRFFPEREPCRLWRCPDTSFEFYGPASLAGDPEFYDGLYSSSAHQQWSYSETRWEFDWIQEIAPAGGRLLDIGAGSGHFMTHAASHFGASVGLETNPYGVENAKAAGLDVRAELIEAHSEANPAAYDVVTANQVLEHVVDVRGFVEASIRALKPGGLLFIAVPNNDGFVGQQPRLPLNLPPHHMGRWTRRSLLAMTEAVGLEVVTVETEPLQASIANWYQGFIEGRYLPQSRLIRSLYYRLGGSAIVARFIAEQRHTIDGHTIAICCRKPLS